MALIVQNLYRVSEKKYTRLMSHKKVTIALILENWLGFDSKSLKLDHDMKTITLGINYFWSLSGYKRLNSQPSFLKIAENRPKIGY